MRIRSPPLEQLIAALQGFHRQHGRLPKSDEVRRSISRVGKAAAGLRTQQQGSEGSSMGVRKAAGAAAKHERRVGQA